MNRTLCSRVFPLAACLVCLRLASADALTRSTTQPVRQPDFSKVPGVVIDHSPAASGLYIGSPSIAVLPTGDYVASHDFFGPKSTEHRSAVSRVFRSSDRGRNWRQIAEIQGQFWSTLFVHRHALYLMGTSHHHGNAIIRRSTDGGQTWTSPTGPACGLLRDDGQYHCAPVPVVEHQGRLWRGMERRQPPVGWGITYCAGMLSVPGDADLLDATKWTFSNFLPGDAKWLGGIFRGWLEGNFVVTPDGRLVDVLRVDTPACPEKGAIVNVSGDGKTLSFDPAAGFVDLPGGSKKFTIRFDPGSRLYWSLANDIPEARPGGPAPASLRNTLALISSLDLRDWSVRSVILRHSDHKKHGFQYVDWLFDGDDMIAACRTAFDDGLGGAVRAHDANFLTFHRIRGFRNLTKKESP
ncbi:MAG: exo-alpha-sialidase [Phycisphaerae bacterium]|nr:exo-alpha-sialidase [Phycisphaerae bacterium]